MKVIILAGGRATRLPHSAKSIPKSLVQVSGKAILDHQLDLLARHGLEDVRFSLGFRADQIIAYFRDTGRDHIEYVVEEEPLGTGGAVRFASQDLASDFMVLNGDTLSDLNLTAMLRFHVPGTALMAAAWREDIHHFGLLDIDDDRIRAFLEKPSLPRPGFINAGCYILHPAHFDGIDERSFMLEQDVFPRLAENGVLRAFLHRGFWQDVGTEERLAEVRNQTLILK